MSGIRYKQPVRALLLPILPALLLTGCFEPNRAYWLKGRGAAAQAVLPHEKDAGTFYPHLAVVEIDEQGDLWSGKEVRRAQDMIKATPKPPIVFIYVHGWQNNARPNNKDLQTFSDYLAELARNPRIAKDATVCGVFIGWRGATFPDWFDSTVIGRLPRFASFWSRLDATNRVAGVSLTRAIGEIVSASRKHPVDRGVSILIGYSFGGRIVERTLGQALVMQHAFSSEQDGALLPADLTILINSASESLYAREIKLALESWKTPRPAIISLTADSDMVTAAAWPFAQTFQHLFGGFRGYDRRGHKESQLGYVFTTAGHKPPTFTHQVRETAQTALPNGQTAFEYNADHASPERFFITANDNRLHTFSLQPLAADRPGALPVGGYWVVDLPPTILRGHGGILEDGGIFSRQITEMIAALFHITNAEDIQSTPRVELKDSE